MANNRPADYKHIRAWGQMIGSLAHYIDGQQQLASETDAPLNAIYPERNGDGEVVRWRTFDDLVNVEMIRRIEEELRHL